MGDVRVSGDEQIMLMLSQMSQKIESMGQKLEGMLNDLSGNLDSVRAAAVKIEIEHGAKLQALIGGQLAAEEKLANHEPRIIKLEEKSSKQDVEIAHLLRKAK